LAKSLLSRSFGQEDSGPLSWRRRFLLTKAVLLDVVTWVVDIDSSKREEYRESSPVESAIVFHGGRYMFSCGVFILFEPTSLKKGVVTIR